MTLNQILYFERIARLGNYHLAAEELYISQPSLSRSMATLEQELGVALFEKKGRGVALTKAGLLFLERADRIIAEYRTTVEQMQELATDGGRIDIGYVFPLAGHYIPHKAKKFLGREENSHVVFNFWQNHTAAITQKVKSGDLDIGFGGWQDREELEYYPMVEQKMVIVTPCNHPLHGTERVPVSELGRYPIIGYDHDSWMGIYTRIFFSKFLINVNITIECSDEYSILSLVKEDFGIALMPTTDVLEHTDNIEIHQIEGMELVHQIFMFWVRDRYRIPAVDRFIDYMKSEGIPENDRENASKVYLKDIVNF